MPETPTSGPVVRKTLRLPQELFDRMEAAAKEDDRDFSAQMRVAARQHLDRRERTDHDLGSPNA